MALEVISGYNGYQLWLEYLTRPTGYTVATVGYAYDPGTNSHASTSDVRMSGTAGDTTFAKLLRLNMNLAGSPTALSPTGGFAWCSAIRIVDVATGFCLNSNIDPAIFHVPFNRDTNNWVDGHVSPYWGGNGQIWDTVWNPTSGWFMQYSANWVANQNGTLGSLYTDGLELKLWDPVNARYTGVWDGQPVGHAGLKIDFAYMQSMTSPSINNPWAYNARLNPLDVGDGVSTTVEVSPVYEPLSVILYPYGPPAERSLAVEFPFDIAITGADTISPGDGTYGGPETTPDDPIKTPGGTFIPAPSKDGDTDSVAALDLENDEADTELVEPVLIDVLANDMIRDGLAELTLYVEPDPLKGTAVINEDNTITFTAVEGFTGLVKFRYQVEDVNGKKARATVRVMVTAPGDPPIIWLDDAPGSLVIIKDKDRLYFLSAGQVFYTYLLSPAVMSLIATSGFYLRYPSDPPTATVPGGWTFNPPILGGAQYVLHAFEESGPLYLTSGLRRYSINRTGVAVLVKDGVVSFDSEPSESEIQAADYYFPGGRDVVIPREVAQLIMNAGKPLEWVTLYVG